MWMSQSGLFRAKWSDDIHEEWVRNVIRIQKKKGLTEANLAILTGHLEKTKNDMDKAVLDARVMGYESIQKTLSGINEKDRHVLAAAIVGKAQMIVTYNLKDFPKNELSSFGIDAVHPDSFLNDQLDLDLDRCLQFTRQARIHFKNPTIDSKRYLEILSQLRLTEFVKALSQYQQEI
jgi:hypothetical protein